MEMKVLKNIANKIDPKGYYSEENIYPSILKEIKKGVAIELEYINDPKLATRIVVHRLMDDPHYYSNDPQNIEERKKKYYKKLYGFWHYFDGVHAEEEADMGDGDGGDGIAESRGFSRTTFMDLLAEIIKSSCKDLNISIPDIEVINDASYTKENNSYAGYSPDLNKIYITIYERTLADIARSVLHELKHAHQNENGRLTNESGQDGDEWENEANSYAGEMMRKWGRTHPEIFFLKYSQNNGDSVTETI